MISFTVNETHATHNINRYEANRFFENINVEAIINDGNIYQAL